MTDEEMAEEYANNIDYTKTVKIFDCVPYHENCDVADMVAQAFLDGLKAGRPQWHDLRKDPTDLPKESCIVYYKDSSGVPSWSVVHPTWYIAGVEAFFENNPQIIAWKEIVLPKESE